jgi:hypothetical protein
MPRTSRSWLATVAVALALATVIVLVLRRKRGSAPGDPEAVIPIRETAAGDVESEDRVGTWADDGGLEVASG